MRRMVTGRDATGSGEVIRVSVTGICGRTFLLLLPYPLDLGAHPRQFRFHSLNAHRIGFGLFIRAQPPLAKRIIEA